MPLVGVPLRRPRPSVAARYASLNAAMSTRIAPVIAEAGSRNSCELTQRIVKLEVVWLSSVSSTAGLLELTTISSSGAQ